MGEGKKKISVAEALADIRAGLSDGEIMEKYGLSRNQLDILFGKLVEANHISKSELEARKAALAGTVELDEEPTAQAPPEPSPGKSREPVTIVPTASGKAALPEGVRQRYARGAALGIGLGIALNILAAIPAQFGDMYAAFGIILGVTGFGLYLWGLYCLVKKKGYHGAYTLVGLIPCFIGLVIMLLVPDKQSDAAPTSGWLIALIIVGVGMVLVAVMGIILAIAIPYYISFKRAACDQTARQEIVRLQDAYDKYRNEPNNKTHEPPQDLSHLVGPYYGWQGTSDKCDVRIHYDRNGQTVAALSLKGAHPRGSTSRYVYKKNLETGQERAAEVVPTPDETRFLSYPGTASRRDRSCFTNDGQLLDECRKAREGH